MTCVVWDNNTHRLYADSKMVKDGEWFNALGKIKLLEKPLDIKALLPDETGVDRIFGWTYTGAALASQGFVDMLTRFTDVSTTRMLYKMAAQAHLGGMNNLFEVILLGGKANYAMRFNIDEESWEVMPHAQGWSIGSGNEIVNGFLKENADPIRALYKTFLEETTCGGMIEVWELTPGKNGRLRRIGMCNALSEAQLRQVTQDMKAPYPLDYVLNTPVTPRKSPPKVKRKKAR